MLEEEPSFAVHGSEAARREEDDEKKRRGSVV